MLQSARPQYWLCPHLYICTTQNGVVFLDARRDRYYGLCGRQLHALSIVVEGWPHQPHLMNLGDTPSLEEALRIAEEYVQAGFLTRDREAGKIAAPVTVNLGSNLVAIGPDVRRYRRIHSLDIWRFLVAYAVAACALRMTSFESIVQRTTARKSQAQRNPILFSPDAAIELVCIFRRLRSFVAFGKNQCLFQALALIEFLARYNQFPAWVIGVRTDPWAAHSWVQHGAFVLDTTPEIIRFYTPILAI